MEKFGLEIFNIENTKTHGGSNRYFIKKSINNNYKIGSNVFKNLSLEKNMDFINSLHIKNFKKKNLSKIKLVNIFDKLKKNNNKIIGYGATAKSCTVLNYCKIDNKTIDFFYDTTSYKINKFLPGSKIKIKKYKKLNIQKLIMFF